MTVTRLSGIRARVLVLVLLAIGPLFLFTVYQGLEERRRVAARERADAQRLVRLLAVEHARVVADAREILFVLAQVPAVRRGEAEACAKMFRDVLARSPQYANLLLVDPDTGVVAGGPPVDLTDEDRTLLAQAQETEFAVSPIRLVGAARAPALTFAHVVPAGSRFPVRVLLARLEMHWVKRAVEAAGVGDLATVTLWDASGRILLRQPDPEGFLGRAAPDSAVARAILTVRGEGTAEADGVDGVRRLYGFTRLTSEADESREIFVSLGVPIHVVFEEQQRLERRNFLVFALVTLLAFVAASLGGDRLLVRLFGRLQLVSERDALTGLANRRRLFSVGEQEQRRARRFGRPLAAAILDLDRFKRVNDRHGHGAGDDVLREVGRRIAAAVRETDLPARYGGEEFAVLLPETDLETAREVAERIRHATAETPLATRRGPVAVTLSGGVALLDEGTGDLTALLDAADAALYAAKAAGRNRVSVAPAAVNGTGPPPHPARASRGRPG